MAEKTEAPTEKKKRDEAKKGQSWKGQDFVVLLVLLLGATFVRFCFPPAQATALFDNVFARQFAIPLDEYALEAFGLFIKWAALTLGAVLLPATLPALIMSRFRFATQAVKVDFKSLNPVSGFKKIFSMRNAKNAIKALLYLAAFGVAAAVFWDSHRRELLGTAQAELPALILLWTHLAWDLVIMSLGCILLLVLTDLLIEYALYIKDLKMTKDEVKREYKEMEGNPEIKGKRKELAHELLNETQKAEVAQSSFVLANPTHIAVGIYLNPEITNWPFISMIETNARALAVIAYAEKIGVPVVRNIPLARGIYRSEKRYTFIDDRWLGEIGEVLRWLTEVEMARNPALAEAMAAHRDGMEGETGDLPTTDAVSQPDDVSDEMTKRSQ